ncbi:5' nucleotidase, NT5C type [Flagellimonas myxillae]|uniref:5' nucleotidase, NT5C type n=1 Tax=Flagellimonas myxillae TaxID=2942214 RepID=UPI00201EAF01|nr:5'(3')-deoxyribonucleotidase [Muricauda myxillae]MCL6266278.1 5'(3')-deoxyribonucleotidase [Muricauda myxillae]
MTIFVDMDEVLADTYLAHLELYEEEFGIALDLAQCQGKEAWDCVPEEHAASMKQHAWQVGFFRDLKVIEGSREVMSELDKKYELYIASAAMQFPNSLKEKSDWLDQYFPFIPWQRRILCGHKYILKGDILIDDRAYNLENFDGRSLMYTSPHNVNTNGFERVNNWEEIANKLL